MNRQHHQSPRRNTRPSVIISQSRNNTARINNRRHGSRSRTRSPLRISSPVYVSSTSSSLSTSAATPAVSVDSDDNKRVHRRSRADSRSGGGSGSGRTNSVRAVVMIPSRSHNIDAGPSSSSGMSSSDMLSASTTATSGNRNAGTSTDGDSNDGMHSSTMRQRTGAISSVLPSILLSTSSDSSQHSHVSASSISSTMPATHTEGKQGATRSTRLFRRQSPSSYLPPLSSIPIAVRHGTKRNRSSISGNHDGGDGTIDDTKHLGDDDVNDDDVKRRRRFDEDAAAIEESVLFDERVAASAGVERKEFNHEIRRDHGELLLNEAFNALDAYTSSLVSSSSRTRLETKYSDDSNEHKDISGNVQGGITAPMLLPSTTVSSRTRTAYNVRDNINTDASSDNINTDASSNTSTARSGISSVQTLSSSLITPPRRQSFVHTHNYVSSPIWAPSSSPSTPSLATTGATANTILPAPLSNSSSVGASSSTTTFTSTSARASESVALSSDAQTRGSDSKSTSHGTKKIDKDEVQETTEEDDEIDDRYPILLSSDDKIVQLDQYKCLICQSSTAYKPVALKPCDHIYCEQCIDQLRENQRREYRNRNSGDDDDNDHKSREDRTRTEIRCPRCREPSKDTRPLSIVEKSNMNMIQVGCPFQSSTQTSCSWSGPLSAYRKHLYTTCPGIKVKCIHCMQTNISRFNLATHHLKCPNMLVTCESCNLSLPRHKYKAHITSYCGNIKVKCTPFGTLAASNAKTNLLSSSMSLAAHASSATEPTFITASSLLLFEQSAAPPCGAGCDEEMTLKEQRLHQERCCPSTLIHCPIRGCNVYTTRAKMMEHEAKSIMEHIKLLSIYGGTSSGNGAGLNGCHFSIHTSSSVRGSMVVHNNQIKAIGGECGDKVIWTYLFNECKWVPCGKLPSDTPMSATALSHKLVSDGTELYYADDKYAVRLTSKSSFQDLNYGEFNNKDHDEHEEVHHSPDIGNQGSSNICANGVLYRIGGSMTSNVVRYDGYGKAHRCGKLKIRRWLASAIVVPGMERYIWILGGRTYQSCGNCDNHPDLLPKHSCWRHDVEDTVELFDTLTGVSTLQAWRLPRKLESFSAHYDLTTESLWIAGGARADTDTDTSKCSTDEIWSLHMPAHELRADAALMSDGQIADYYRIPVISSSATASSTGGCGVKLEGDVIAADPTGKYFIWHRSPRRLPFPLDSMWSAVIGQ